MTRPKTISLAPQPVLDELRERARLVDELEEHLKTARRDRDDLIIQAVDYERVAQILVAKAAHVDRAHVCRVLARQYHYRRGPW